MDTRNLLQEISTMHADLCSAVADPNRILILYELAHAPRNVGELAAALNLSPSTASRHLKILKDRDILRAERQGHTVVYHLLAKELIDALEIFRSVLNDQLTHRARLLEMDKNNEAK